jgi:hypothetical protein
MRNRGSPARGAPSVVASANRPSHAGRTLSRVAGQPWPQGGMPQWREIGKNKTGSSGCRAGQIHMPGRTRKRSTFWASRLTGTAQSTGIGCVPPDIPSRPTGAGNCAVAWVRTRPTTSVTQSRRASRLPSRPSSWRPRWPGLQSRAATAERPANRSQRGAAAVTLRALRHHLPGARCSLRAVPGPSAVRHASRAGYGVLRERCQPRDPRRRSRPPGQHDR